MTGLLVSAFNAFHRWRQGTALLYLRIKDDLRAGRRVAEQDGERCESGHRACLRIGAADRDYVRNCADRDDVRCLRIGTTSDELGIYEWDAGAGRTTNIKDLRSGRVARGRHSNYLGSTSEMRARRHVPSTTDATGDGLLREVAPTMAFATGVFRGRNDG